MMHFASCLFFASVGAFAVIAITYQLRVSWGRFCEEMNKLWKEW